MTGHECHAHAELTADPNKRLEPETHSQAPIASATSTKASSAGGGPAAYVTLVMRGSRRATRESPGIVQGSEVDRGSA